MQKLAAFLKRFHSGPAADAYEYLGCHTHEDGEGYVFPPVSTTADISLETRSMLEV